MDRNIEELKFFSDICWKTNILSNINNEELVEYSYKIKNTQDGLNVSNNLGYHSPYLKTNDDCDVELVSLRNEIVSFAKTLLEDKFYNDTSKLIYSLDCWFNINPKNSYNDLHIHGGNVLLSFVYYAKIPKEKTAPFYFRMPSLKSDKISSFGIDKDSDFSTFNGFYPIEGDLIAFPGWIEHGVRPNTSDEDRISYAFNFRVRNSE